MMSNHLFLYGTLLPRHAPAEIAPAVARLRRLDEGTVRGYLYDLGEYPGAVADESAAGCIHGTIFEMPEDDALLSALDDYEGFDPKHAETSLFVRALHPVTLAAGGVLLCWMYAYNRVPARARLIPGGRYREI
jgi:gamma-glutamylcyclotransferase (GGCT)/AIG2-like uncharacterized protein YtfP